MRAIIILLFFSILFIYTKRKSVDGFSRRLLYLYLAYWLIAMLLAVMQISNLFYVSNYALLLLCLNVLSFVFGFNILKISSQSEISVNQLEVAVDNLMSKTVFKVFLIGCTVLVLFLFSFFFQRVMYFQSIYDVRSEYYDNELYGEWFPYLRYFLLWPMSILIIPLFAYTLFYKRSVYTIIMAIYLLAYESLGGGRGGYFVIIIGFIFVLYCILNVLNGKNIKKIVILLASIVVLFLIISIITAGRGGNLGTSKNTVKEGMEETFRQMGIYTAAPIVAFDYSIQDDYLNRIGGHKYGKLTLSSAEELFNLFGSRIGLTFSMNDLQRFVTIKQNEFIVVGDNEGVSLHYNALYTAALWFYLDFGIFGVILIPFLLGVVVRWVIMQTYKNISCAMLAVCFTVSDYAIDSVKDFYLRSGYALLMLIILFFIGKKNRIPAKK